MNSKQLGICTKGVPLDHGKLPRLRGFGACQEINVDGDVSCPVTDFSEAGCWRMEGDERKQSGGLGRNNPYTPNKLT